MHKRFYIGLGISVFNLVFFAIVLDLLFDSGIFLMLFGVNLIEVCGSAATPLGIAAAVIAIGMEFMSYRVIRHGVVEDSEGSKQKSEIS